jgi:hypothetical protein
MRAAASRCRGAGRVFVKQAMPGSATQTKDDRIRARSVVNEQITGQLGALMGAPVARTVLVEVTDRTSQPGAADPLPRGVHHGSVLIENLGEPVKRPTEWRKVDAIPNRDRFALLAMLYGWVYCSYDHQVSFETSPPRFVWCYDHGFTIGLGQAPLTRGGDSRWDSLVLENRRTVAVDRVFQQAFGFAAGDLRKAVTPLESIDAPRIAAVIASIPNDWYCTDDERVALARYLNDRRLQLLARYS